MQILPNIYLLDGFAYAQHANFYLVHNEQGNIVIDAGTIPADLERAEQQLSLWGISLEQVDTLLLTHSHYDHVGNAAELRRRGATVIAGSGDAEGIELADWRTAPYAAGFKVPACTVDRVVQDGEVIEAGGFRFEVIQAPGHTHGSVIYQLRHAGKIIWFAGDVVMINNTNFEPELGWQGGEDFDKPTYLQTLRRLAELPVDCILAGHYFPYLSEGRRLVGRAYVKALVEWR
jgi:glyoxylase-like metal-dependent hydrolase (beta-lactamase superfamily II)